jgi:hypothetical protein
MVMMAFLRPILSDRLADDVHDPAERRLADRDLDRPAQAHVGDEHAVAGGKLHRLGEELHGILDAGAQGAGLQVQVAGVSRRREDRAEALPVDVPVVWQPVGVRSLVVVDVERHEPVAEALQGLRVGGDLQLPVQIVSIAGIDDTLQAGLLRSEFVEIGIWVGIAA